MNKFCLQCKKEFSKPYTRSLLYWSKTKYCSRICVNKNKIGKKHTEEHKQKISEALKSKDYSWMIGIPHGHKTNYPGTWKCPDEIKARFSEERKGRVNERWLREGNPNWKGGVAITHHQIRMSPEYRLWRMAVLERDKYTCLWCGQRGGKIQADHIKSFAYYPELRFVIDNGRTLCIDCHKKTDNFGGRGIKRKTDSFEIIK